MSVLGIDVAMYEPQINWTKVQQAGYKFAFIKCSQSDYNDPLFSEHWKNSKTDGMPRGPYHFYDPRYVSPHVQAEKFFTSLGNDLGELPFVTDIEKYTTGPYHGSRYWYDYMERLNTLSGNHPHIIYTAPSYWTSNVFKIPSVVDVNYFKKYDLWIANYLVSSPFVPIPWTSWKFWQYDDAFVDGVTDTLGRPTKCDRDEFNGTQEEFDAYLLAQPGEPPPMSDYIELKSASNSNHSIRRPTAYPTTPHIIGTTFATLQAGTTASANPEDFYVYPEDVFYNGIKQAYKSDKWWRITVNGDVGWIAEVHKGIKYLNTRLVPGTVTPTHTVEVIVDGVTVYKTELS
jgi:lysozyme